MVTIVVVLVLMALRLRISGKSIYSKGIADHYWPCPVFLLYLILSRAMDPKGITSYRPERISIPPWGGVNGLGAGGLRRALQESKL